MPSLDVLPDAPPRRTKVLVVDDEPAVRRALRLVLERGLPGLDVLTAADGPAALAALEQGGVDLILTDFRMPEMDGLAFLAAAERLRAGSRKILLTAFPDLEILERATNEAHVDRFLLKPWDSAELLTAVQSLLAEDRAEAARSAAFARSLETLRRQVQ